MAIHFAVATGRRPPDLQTIAMRVHQESRLSLDPRKDVARCVMPSDGPYGRPRDCLAYI